MIIEFDVDAENQKALIEEILSWGDPSRYPGFVSANVHASRDGCRVLNYTQRPERAYEEFRVARATEETEAKMEAIGRLGVWLRKIRAYGVVRVVQAAGLGVTKATSSA